MRVLVAGGAGFIGLHLVKALLDEGHQVSVIDNFLTGWPVEDARRFLGNRGPEVEFHDMDIKGLFGQWDFDLIYNLACPASPIHYQKDRVDTLMTSVLGTYNLLMLAHATGARFVQASTSEIYGDPEVHPQAETYVGHVNPIGPRACYDEGKRAAETLCFDFRRDRGVDARVVRIFNTYGPWMHEEDGRLVNTFVQQALKEEPITVFGTGQQTRSLCYVDDLVRGLVMVGMIDHLDVPVNLGNPAEYTVLSIAERVRDFLGSKSPIVFKPLPADDPKQRRPDISRAQKMLNWTPTIPFDVGLELTVCYFKEVLDK